MKYLTALLLIATVPLVVSATAPPGGWGTDCTNYINTSTPYTSNDLIYDPVAGFYRDCGSGLEVVWPEFQFDLWIEMEIIVHFDWTQAEIHRASLYSDVTLVVPGYIEQNSGNYIIVRPLGNDPNGRPYSLDYMNFIEDIFGRTGIAYGSDIPTTWEYSLTGPTGPWSAMDPGSGGAYQFLIEEPCHHDFWYRVVMDIDEHENDGFYKMHGDLCPVPPL